MALDRVIETLARAHPAADAVMRKTARDWAVSGKTNASRDAPATRLEKALSPAAAAIVRRARASGEAYAKALFNYANALYCKMGTPSPYSDPAIEADARLIGEGFACRKALDLALDEILETVEDISTASQRAGRTR